MQAVLRRYSKLVCAATLALIFIGGMVTSTGSGLSVPDWPTTYGHQMFAFPLSQMQGGIFYEHSHRMVAAVVGFLTLILAVWLPFGDARHWVRNLGFAALGAVVLQGVLGGVTVLLKLPPLVSICHGILAQSFLVLTIVIAYSLSLERAGREAYQPETHPLAGAAVLVAALVYVQLIVGALMRHTHSGLAIPDFPTMGGSLLPFFDQNALVRINAMLVERGLREVTLAQVWIHFLHRFGAVVVTLGLIVLNIRARACPLKVRATLFVMDALLLMQLGLGVFTILSGKQPIITSLHVMTGAALLGMSVLLALRASPLKLRQKTETGNAHNVLQVQVA